VKFSRLFLHSRCIVHIINMAEAWPIVNG
jgi:hypothetical protein